MSAPIRNLLFSTLYPSAERPVHGIFVETRLRELLRTGGVEPTVLAPVPWFPSKEARWGDYARFARTPAREQRHGIDVLHPRYLSIPKLGMSVAPFLLALACRPVIQRLLDSGRSFDLIDAHYFYPDGVAAALLARHFQLPLVITARGSDLTVIPRYAVPRALIRWAARRADAAVGVCSALVDVLRGWNLDPARLHVIRNGVDFERFQPELLAAARNALGLAAGPLILSVGRLVELKGHHLTIEAMTAIRRVHPSARLVVVGDGPERARLEALIERLGMKGVVTLLGNVPQSELPRWYSAADLMVLASSSEGWANVLLEAMACGTPVVATRTWGTPEVVGDRGAGLLVDERSAPALASAVLQMLSQPPARAAVLEYAREFSWEQTSQAQLRLFGQLVPGTRMEAR